jgi:hypothetical protein
MKLAGEYAENVRCIKSIRQELERLYHMQEMAILNKQVSQSVVKQYKNKERSITLPDDPHLNHRIQQQRMIMRMLTTITKNMDKMYSELPP